MHFSRIKAYIADHERQLSFGALALGFIVDSFTLTRIDQWLDNLILGGYLFLAGLSIILFNHLQESSRIRIFLPYILQYALGGLFSGFFIFYSRSGSLWASWPFIITLLYLLIGNETFKERYEKYVFRISIYFTALYLFFIFFVPVVLGIMSSAVFILSGIVAITCIVFVVWVIEQSKYSMARTKRYHVYIAVIVITLLFNALYFLKIIPPIPLSLKDLNVYHSIERINENYSVTQEKRDWWQFYSKNTYTIPKGSSIVGYSAVFAPTRINQTISHHWLYKKDGSWRLQSKIPFPISGGRDNGYRGYTLKEHPEEGLWRLEIRTERKQLLGRKDFTVVHGTPNEIEIVQKN